jgi:hypothetical protein
MISGVRRATADQSGPNLLELSEILGHVFGDFDRRRTDQRFATDFAAHHAYSVGSSLKRSINTLVPSR